MDNRFWKYRELGAYHYRSTLGARRWREFDARLCGRYVAAVKLLELHSGWRVLDAGSGEGVASIMCCRLGARCTAIEREPEAVRLAQEIAEREMVGKSELRVLQGNLYQMELESDSQDAVISLEVIEHIEDEGKYLKELVRVLRPGGKLVISTPHRRPNGELQDPYHVREYDGEALCNAVVPLLGAGEVFSGWSKVTERVYRRKSGGLLRRGVRALIKYFAFHGINVFAFPARYSAECPVILFAGRKR